jgi:hypothetical protein
MKPVDSALLPATLVNDLREALSGDLRAERDLLRDALAQALEGLHNATEAIEAGLSMTAEVAPKQPKPLRLGTLMKRRVRLITEFRDELPELVSADDMQAFLTERGEPNVTEGAAGHVLWTLDKMGIVFERVGRGVYGWRAE